MRTFDDAEQKKRTAQLHKLEEEELARILSSKYGVKYIDLSQTSISTDALRLLKEKDARAYEVALFGKVAKKLSLAVRAPKRKEVAIVIKDLEVLGYKVDVFMVSSASLERAWERYKDLSFAVESKAGVFDISGDDITALIQRLQTTDAVKKYVKEVMELKKAYRVSRILEALLAGAMGLRASDIHIEPEETYVRLRYRLDGVLTEVLSFDTKTYELVLSRIKLLSGLKLNIHNKAQDGRFSLTMNENNIEMRISILPGAYGESIVMRVLNPDAIAVSIEELGIPLNLREIIEHEISKPNGMILITGPTGSGKTTTLYAFLRKIHTPDIKIITIEDPIEYHLPGIVQTQTDGDRYTFASGLRSSLRQDPDVIMVGEIRDKEVASTAINASLTGHLVFSTLHTNNAAGTLPRLIDLGVNPKVIGSAINLIIAQRLIRQLKDGYKKEITLEGKDKEMVHRILDSIYDKTLIPKDVSTIFEATEDSPNAYKGRKGVFEAIIVDEEIEKIVSKNLSEREINHVTKKQGILTMAQDGILKALQGDTSLSELRRVIDLEENMDL